MTKQLRKVALINVADYPREQYNAHWHISVQGNDVDGFMWKAQIHSFEPIGYQWQGKTTPQWPEGVARPVYPPDVPVRQEQYLKMTPAEQAQVRAQQEVRRAECSRIFESSPKAIHLHDENSGTVAPTDIPNREQMAPDALARAMRDTADAAAQTWVKAEMAKYKKASGAGVVHGYAIPIPVDLLPSFADIKELVNRLIVRPLLMALSYATTLRNSRMDAITTAIDAGAGAGLWRIYDGTRPASCGTATTLLAELTFTDPAAPAASGGVLTFSSITADSSANATGTATWSRMVDSTGTCCVDGDVGTSGSDLNLNSTSINAGVQVSISSASITEGNA
jgi:hypothetical protein